MKVLILLCLFLTAISSGLLSIVSSLLGMLALVSIFLIPMKSALILLVSAWLISPAGLPLIAQKLLEVLYAGCETDAGLGDGMNMKNGAELGGLRAVFF